MNRLQLIFSIFFFILIGLHGRVGAQTSITTKVDIQKHSKSDIQIQKCNGNLVCGSFYKMGNPINGRIKFNKSGLWGFVDYDGNEIIPPIYSEVSDFDESGHAKFLKLSKKKKQFQYGLINQDGNITIPPKFDGLGKCQNNRIWAMKKEKVGFLSCGGKEVLPLKFESVVPFSEGIAAYKNKKGRFQFIDKDGHKYLKATYQNAGQFRNGTTYVKDNENWYLIDKTGKKRTGPLPYDSISAYQDGLYAVKSGDHFGRINQKGEIIIPIEFQDLKRQRRIRHFTETKKDQNGTKTEYKTNLDLRFIFAKKNDRWGLLDTSGKTILPIKFADIETTGFVNNNIRVLDENGNILFFDTSGQQQTAHELPWKFEGFVKKARDR